jgi:hypothetical protein
MMRAKSSRDRLSRLTVLLAELIRDHAGQGRQFLVYLCVHGPFLWFSGGR